jgi:hypothetical protein
MQEVKAWNQSNTDLGKHRPRRCQAGKELKEYICNPRSSFKKKASIPNWRDQPKHSYSQTNSYHQSPRQAHSSNYLDSVPRIIYLFLCLWVAFLKWEQWMTFLLLTSLSSFLSILLMCGPTPYHSHNSSLSCCLPLTSTFCFSNFF